VQCTWHMQARRLVTALVRAAYPTHADITHMHTGMSARHLRTAPSAFTFDGYAGERLLFVASADEWMGRRADAL